MGKEKKKKRHQSSSDSEVSSDNDSISSPESSDELEGFSPVKKPRKQSSSSNKKHKKEKKKKKHKKHKKEVDHEKSIEKISKDDYFLKNSEFRLWLKQNSKVKKSFGEMETAEAKTYFKEFVKKWNKKKLPKEFYKGVDALDESARTDFRWGFAENMDHKTKLEVEALKKASKETHQDSPGPTTKNCSSQNERSFSTFGESPFRPPSCETPVETKIIGPVLPANIAAGLKNKDFDGEGEQDRFEEKMAEKRFRDHKKVVEEELCPKATGYEARIEKRAMENERRRNRDTSPGLSDKVLLGDSNFMGKAIDRRKEKRVVKQEVSIAKAKEKMTAYAEKEKEKMAALLEMAKCSRKEGALWKLDV